MIPFVDPVSVAQIESFERRLFWRKVALLPFLFSAALGIYAHNRFSSALSLLFVGAILASTIFYGIVHFALGCPNCHEALGLFIRYCESCRMVFVKERLPRPGMEVVENDDCMSADFNVPRPRPLVAIGSPVGLSGTTEDIALLSNGVALEGIVANIVYVGRGSYLTLVSYSVDSGTIEKTFRLLDDFAFSPGDNVMVVVDPADPKQAVLYPTIGYLISYAAPHFNDKS